MIFKQNSIFSKWLGTRWMKQEILKIKDVSADDIYALFEIIEEQKIELLEDKDPAVIDKIREECKEFVTKRPLGLVSSPHQHIQRMMATYIRNSHLIKMKNKE